FQVDDISSASGSIDAVMHGQASEGRRKYGLPPITETVTVATVDALVENRSLPVPQVIKIDVQGAELRVLRGARETLERHSPRLAIENHGVEVARAVVGFLLKAGYHVFGELQTSKETGYREVHASDI